MAQDEAALRGHTEAQILSVINEGLAIGGSSDEVLTGPGDDTAWLRVRSGAVLVTTDAMVLGRDWRNDWSSPRHVGRKCVAQNAADIEAMGGTTTGLVVTLVADPATPLAWVRELAVGLGQEAAQAGAVIVGGDLSSAGPGVCVISATALGELPVGAQPVLRSGARPGDVLAVSGPLGRAAAGLLLLQEDRGYEDPELVGYQQSPRPAYGDGRRALEAAASAMLDVSDGLLLDAGRIAQASGVRIDVHTAALAADIAALAAVGDEATECVLRGGEEHVLLATFAAGDVPSGWRVIGTVARGAGVSLDGHDTQGGGWEHFAVQQE
ncbi:thiamine-phosphate kinase [Branchiibius sp. NY16-3462-2]|uniref:thiamine-phosphate kinase n=1 Tax=Branchiibius sp. NY16-3462-2 TaxID=1807500 RepID=UPI0007967265|nr:thiamine-phosphate kinase [Branchiibius sp. NY16-3462-2]KYH43310.1 hypothetical protein AZH51_13255 [Branchiibius sp. NY16-3462-2]